MAVIAADLAPDRLWRGLPEQHHCRRALGHPVAACRCAPHGHDADHPERPGPGGPRRLIRPAGRTRPGRRRPGPARAARPPARQRHPGQGPAVLGCSRPSLHGTAIDDDPAGRRRVAGSVRPSGMLAMPAVGRVTASPPWSSAGAGGMSSTRTCTPASSTPHGVATSAKASATRSSNCSVRDCPIGTAVGAKGPHSPRPWRSRGRAAWTPRPGGPHRSRLTARGQARGPSHPRAAWRSARGSRVGSVRT